MSLSEESLQKARDMLEGASNPLFFYHDDPDGLCSFLILQKAFMRGHGHIVKASPYLTAEFLPKVEEHKSDLIVVLDIAHIEDDFIAQAGLPILWIDHHEPNAKRGTHYLNPRINGENLPVSWMCHLITEQSYWLGFAGCVSDWVVPPHPEKFAEKYPGVISEPYTPEHLLFDTPLGTLVKAISFNLKGPHSEVRKSISCLLKIKEPSEILVQSTPPGKFIWKKFNTMNREYTQILNEALAQRRDDAFLTYLYHDAKTSLTKDIANEVYARNKDKIVLVGREKNGKVMFSLRAMRNLPPALAAALQGLEGKGGGHEHACGGWVMQDQFNTMYDRLKQELQ